MNRQPPSFVSLFIVGLVTNVAVGSVSPSANAKEIDLGKTQSRVEFLAVGKPSAVKIRGKALVEAPSTSAVRGTLKVAGNQVSGKASLVLTTLDTGIALRTRHMKKKYLETDKYPEAEITIIKLSLPETLATQSELQAKDIPFEGILQLHGVAKPIQGAVAIDKKSGKSDLTFAFKVRTPEHNLVVAEFMGIRVGDDVDVVVCLEGLAL